MTGAFHRGQSEWRGARLSGETRNRTGLKRATAVGMSQN